MKILETAKFKKQRKKLVQEIEKQALKRAIQIVLANPEIGKKLKGEFKDLHSFKYMAVSQQRRLIYKIEGDSLILLSFGPREGIYK